MSSAEAYNKIFFSRIDLNRSDWTQSSFHWSSMPLYSCKLCPGPNLFHTQISIKFELINIKIELKEVSYSNEHENYPA